MADEGTDIDCHRVAGRRQLKRAWATILSPVRAREQPASFEVIDATLRGHRLRTEHARESTQRTARVLGDGAQHGGLWRSKGELGQVR